MLQKIKNFFFNADGRNKKLLKPLYPLVQRINDLEPLMRSKTDEDLQQQTFIFKERLAQGATLDDLLPEAFATVREASRRVLNMRHFDVQLIGGIALHRGMIAEMKTGEGKTLVATAPVYLNALAGRGVHVVTVNDYLAKRDSEHMEKLYGFLGMTVGCIVQDLNHQERKTAYGSDITYGTNNEFGFDYLRDNMKYSVERMCQRPFYFAIVDEVDSILIDEARTPLIISGPVEDTESLYEQANDIILHVKPEHYEKDEKHKSVAFTDLGYEFVEELCREKGIMQGHDLFQPVNVMLVHHLNQALKAHKSFQKDVDYIVKDDKVMIIDEFTGRIMKGRRYSDGLHQALEAKEYVEIELENQTVASITFQNYFRMYPKLSGMTGTGATEAGEFQEIYNLPVLVVPTNTPVRRKDHDDEIFRTFDQKLKAIVKQTRQCYERKQPILIGTASIEKSEIFAKALMKEGLPFHVLNARHHEKEAQIIAQAGMPGAITIATNMAGRGTDIKLGGNLSMRLEEALEGITDEAMIENITHKVTKAFKKDEELAREAGGLYVLGTERHESRRIDNQLRGRSGRQGDPGASKFFISLEDDLMRIFGPNLALMNRLWASSENKKMKKAANNESNQEEDDGSEAIQSSTITRALEKAQKRVEAQHFETRKHLLKYANVLNDQRQAVYTERYKLMAAEDIQFEPLCLHILDTLISTYKERDNLSKNGSRPLIELEESLERVFNIDISLEDLFQRQGVDIEMLKQNLALRILENLKEIQEELGPDNLKRIVKSQYLKMLDHAWTSHLNTLEHLRESIYLQAYGQKDPLNEYKRESFLMFQSMIDHWHQNFLSFLFHLDPEDYAPEEDMDDDEGGNLESSLERLMNLLKGEKTQEENWDDEDEDDEDDDDWDEEDDEEDEEEDPRVSSTSLEDLERRKAALENAMKQLLEQLKKDQESLEELSQQEEEKKDQEEYEAYDYEEEKLTPQHSWVEEHPSEPSAFAQKEEGRDHHLFHPSGWMVEEKEEDQGDSNWIENLKKSLQTQEALKQHQNPKLHDSFENVVENKGSQEKPRKTKKDKEKTLEKIETSTLNKRKKKVDLLQEDSKNHKKKSSKDLEEKEQIEKKTTKNHSDSGTNQGKKNKPQEEKIALSPLEKRKTTLGAKNEEKVTEKRKTLGPKKEEKQRPQPTIKTMKNKKTISEEKVIKKESKAKKKTLGEEEKKSLKTPKKKKNTEH